MREYTDRELAVLEQTHRSAEFTDPHPIAALLTPETVMVPLEARTKRSLLESLVEVAGRTWHVWQPAVLLSAVQDRESVLSTAFENGVAIPHPRNPLPEALGQSVIAYGRLSSGIPFGAPRHVMTDLFFLVACRDSRTHLHVLARLGRLLQTPGFVDDLRAIDNSSEAYDFLCQADRQIIV
jgi:PTS system nitrogen regulatory IIA component